MRYIRAEGPENTVMLLHRTYDSVLYRNSVKYLNPPCMNRMEHSFDVTQDTWLSVFSALQNYYDNPGDRFYEKPLAWLLTINRNKCFHHLKTYISSATDISIGHDSDFQEIPFHTTNPLEQLIEDENYRRLQQIISCLPERDQKVLRLYKEGVSHIDIGATLDISPVMSRQILCRALGKIESEVNKGRKI